MAKQGDCGEMVKAKQNRRINKGANGTFVVLLTSCGGLTSPG